MLEDLSREDITQSLDRAVQELLDAAGITAPPVDAIALARNHLGMTVALDHGQQQRGGHSVPPAVSRSTSVPNQPRSATSGPSPTRLAST